MGERPGQELGVVVVGLQADRPRLLLGTAGADVEEVAGPGQRDVYGTPAFLPGQGQRG
jgi:hypothetical protein